MGEKVIKSIKRGNCIVNFVKQTNTESENYLENLHKEIATLLVNNYNNKVLSPQ